MGYTNSSPVDEWLTPSKLELVKCWARDFSFQDIADKMGITVQTLRKWRKDYPEIKEAIEENREVLDYKIENALIKRALGYTTLDVKTILGPPDKNGNRTVRVEKVEKEVPPDTTAIMAWLNNRKPDQWKRNRDNVIQTNDTDSKITVNIIRHTNKEDDDEEWNATTEKKPVSKVSSKKPSDDLDFWPDDWDEE